MQMRSMMLKVPTLGKGLVLHHNTTQVFHEEVEETAGLGLY